MRGLSFIGVGNYQSTTYIYGEKRKNTKFVQEAIADFFELDEILIFATKEAKKMYFEEISERLKIARFVEIPEGKNKDELWEIFKIITQNVQEGERIIFDITHGFRSIPFVSYLSIAYLKEIKKVKVEKVLYGAFDPRKNDETIIVDLTDFVTILDWMTAVRDFLKYSNALELSNLMKDVHLRFDRESTEYKPQKIRRLANKLKNFSIAFHLSRPKEVFQYANSIVEDIDEASKEISCVLPPVALIIDKIKNVEKYSGEWKLDYESLKRQLELIKQQFESGLIVQAIELAREWFLSYITLRLNYKINNWLNRNTREVVEKTVTGLIKKRIGDQYTPTELMEKLESLEDVERLLKTWDRLSQLRNDLAHCGMRENPADIRKIRNEAGKIIEELFEILHA